MSEENETTRGDTKAKPVQAKPAPAPAIRAFPDNARITPQPRPRPKAPTMPVVVPRAGTVERHFHDHTVEGDPVPTWKHAAAKALYRWPNGAEISRDAYDKALERAANVTIS